MLSRIAVDIVIADSVATPPPMTFDAETMLINPLERLTGYQIRRASAWILADLARTLEDLNLRPTEASILLLIEANPDITQSDIGRALGIKRANMAPLAASLGDSGLIDKVRADGRSQALRLTVAGAELVTEISQRIAAHEARFLQDLAPTRRVELTALLQDVWNR